MNEGEPTSLRAWLRDALDRFERPLVRYAARLVGDPDRARDIVQETFTRLCREDPAQLDGRLAEWLFTVCRNRAIDVRRKESRMTPMTAAVAETQSCSEPPPGVAVERAEAAGTLLRLVEGLPERQQEAIRLKFHAGLSYKQIAKVMGTTVSNVGVMLHTAIKSLREQMGGEP